MTSYGECPKCGTELEPRCPICHEPVEVYTRIVGYLRPTSTWNPGKQEEYKRRTEFVVDKHTKHQKGV